MAGKKFHSPVKFLRRLVSRFQFRRTRKHADDTAPTDNDTAPPAQVKENELMQLTQPRNAVHRPLSPKLSARTFERATIQNVGGNFITTAGHGNTVYHATVQARENRARETLRELAVRDAMHTGKVRADPLACDSNTRQAVVERIISWMEDSQRDNNVLWLCGPAGIGKSAIAKTIADRLDVFESSVIMVGSFFFFRSDQKRNTLQSFVPTLAYQLAVSIQVAGERIDGVIEGDPEVLNSNVEVQWRKLIVDVVRAFSDLPPATMVIDGLDECGGPEDQRKVLELVASCGPYFPISFLVASRPEPHISNSFDVEPLSLICRVVIDLVTYKNDQEMEMFVRTSFSRIYNEHFNLLQFYSVDSIWPSDEIIDLITGKADGQFIYPVTLFKYIGENNGNPNERLQACLEHTTTALSPLDALYIQILQSSLEPHDAEIQDFFFLLVPVDNREPLTLFTTSVVLGLNTAEFRSKLRRIYSVVDVPEDDYNEIRIYHQSFIDFLLDPDRSSVYHIKNKECAFRIVERSLSALEVYPPDPLEIRPLLQCWWSCSQLLSHEDVAPGLAMRMEKLDFERILRISPGSSAIHFMNFCYNEFVKLCRSWVDIGSRESKRPQDSELWINSSLTTAFEEDALLIATQARKLMTHFKALEKKSHDDVNGVCPLSWSGLHHWEATECHDVQSEAMVSGTGVSSEHVSGDSDNA